jgi:CheY-like chemotaxis protein
LKILIIEDDPVKLKAISAFIKFILSEVHLEERTSYQSGLFAIMHNVYDLILLDMQLPNYDIKSGEDGYKLRPVAGRDILREVKRKRLKSSVVIVTQYEGFGENGIYNSLDEWHQMLRAQFPEIYLQTIRYKPGSNSWKEELTPFIKQKDDKNSGN